MLTFAYMGGGGCQKWPKTCLRNSRMAPNWFLAKLFFGISREFQDGKILGNILILDNLDLHMN